MKGTCHELLILKKIYRIIAKINAWVGKTSEVKESIRFSNY